LVYIHIVWVNAIGEMKNSLWFFVIEIELYTLVQCWW